MERSPLLVVGVLFRQSLDSGMERRRGRRRNWAPSPAALMMMTAAMSLRKDKALSPGPSLRKEDQALVIVSMWHALDASWQPALVKEWNLQTH